MLFNLSCSAISSNPIGQELKGGHHAFEIRDEKDVSATPVAEQKLYNNFVSLRMRCCKPKVLLLIKWKKK